MTVLVPLYPEGFEDFIGGPGAVVLLLLFNIIENAGQMLLGKTDHTIPSLPFQAIGTELPVYLIYAGSFDFANEIARSTNGSI